MKRYKQFIIGVIVGAMLFSIMPISAAIEEFICYRADYKVMINGQEYVSEELPILNYKGNTYAPFRSVLEAAGLDVNWNAELGQAEVLSATSTQNNNVEEDNMSEAKEYTPDGIEVTLYRGRRIVTVGDFKTRYKDTEYRYGPGEQKGQSAIIKNDEIILNDVQLIEKTFFFDYDYYCNTILPILK